MNEDTDIESRQKIWAVYGSQITVSAILISLLAAIVCIILGIREWHKGTDAMANATTRLADMGNVGSYLQGTTASLWALAGFFIIFVAFLIQAMQFAEQRKQFKVQTDSVNRQSFEAAFFQLLGLHNDIVLGMTAKDDTSGRDCFKAWYTDFDKGTWGNKNEPIPGSIYGETRTTYVPKNGIEKYLAFYFEDHQGELGHYFRNLYHLFKFVEEAEALKNSDHEAEYKTRRRYTSLVRATLSQYELALLFYNCASELGEEKFKPLVEKYGLLKNFNTDDLLKTETKTLFDPKAFA